MNIKKGNCKQKKYLTIYVTSSTVEGTLNQYTRSDNESKMTRGNTEYCVNYIFDKINTKEPKAGYRDVFLRDIFGAVIALQDTDSGVGKYGVLLSAFSDDSGSTVNVRFLNSKNRIKTYEITENTVVNGSKYKDFSKLSWLTGNNQALKGSVVKFETNSKGELSRFYIAAGAGYESELDKKIDNRRMRYKSGRQFFGGAEVAVRDNTSIFVVSNEINSNDDCECVTRNYLGNDV